ncbi:MAG: energy transducer TonB [Bacteroidota bacterium]
MEKLQILTADLLDIVFEGRNKSYGAYELRKTYDRRMVYAFSGTALLCLLFLVSSILANGKKRNGPTEILTSIELENFKKDEPKIEPPKPLPKPEPQKVEMSKFNPPKIVKDEDVTPEDEIKDVERLEETKIGNLNQDGTKDDGVVAPPVENITGVVKGPEVKKDIDEVYTIVQVEARFPGDIAGWKKYLEQNLNRDLPAENGAPAADYTVTVSFIVDRNGVISDVKAENDPGYGTKAEAIRVIKKSPNWTPAIQNGQHVVYRQKQNITFRIAEQ